MTAKQRRSTDTPASVFLGNPVPLGLSLKVVGFVARILLESGVVKLLQDKAAASESQVDDVIVDTVVALLTAAAKL